jgi:hypothetical protein
MSGALVVASRLHWNNHARDAAIDAEKALAQVRAFYTRAAAYGDAVVLALGLPSPTEPSSAFTESVVAFAKNLHDEISAPSWLDQRHESGRAKAPPMWLVPMSFWGQFVPALNAIVSTAATQVPDATHILFQSLEIQVPESGVAHLRHQFLDGSDLVIGAALPGHAFAPHEPQPLPLDGVTTPWNTLALWDLRQLAKIGFPLVGDGLGLPVGTAGVEEVSTIALYQQLYPARSKATVVEVPGLAWHVEDFADEQRRAWQQRKMESKKARPAQQLAHLQFASPGGEVYHVATVEREN